jgi:hypothetical protein
MAISYLTEPKPLTINLLTNYTDVLQWFLIFAPQTRPARLPRASMGQALLQTPSRSPGPTESPTRYPLAYVSLLDATLMGAMGLTLLDATLTKNTGVGATFLSTSRATTAIYFHAVTGTHFATLLFSDSCRNGGGGYPSRPITEAPLKDFDLRLLTASSQRTPLLSSTSHRSPVTSHLQ